MTIRIPRQRVVVPVVALGLLVAVAYGRFAGRQAAHRPAQPAAAARSVEPDAPESAILPVVALSRLDAPRVAVSDQARDPFRFGRASQGAGPDGTTTRDRPRPPVVRGDDSGAALGVSGPPPPPPIPLKFIGLVKRQDDGVRIAVLSDGRGVYYGREGDVIEGQYRLWRIGTDVVELSYADGRGRQTIRLSGS